MVMKKSDDSDTNSNNKDNTDNTSSNDNDYTDNTSDISSDKEDFELEDMPVVENPESSRFTKTYEKELHKFHKFLTKNSKSNPESVPTIEEISELFDMFQDEESIDAAVDKFLSEIEEEVDRNLDDLRSNINLPTDDFIENPIIANETFDEEQFAMTDESLKSLWHQLSNEDELQLLDCFIAEEIIAQMIRNNIPNLLASSELEIEEDHDHEEYKFRKEQAAIQKELLKAAKAQAKERKRNQKFGSDNMPEEIISLSDTMTDRSAISLNPATADTSEITIDIEDLLRQCDQVKDDLQTMKLLREQDIVRVIRNKTKLKLDNHKSTLRAMERHREELLIDLTNLLESELTAKNEFDDYVLSDEEMEMHELMIAKLKNVEPKHFFSFITALNIINLSDDQMHRDANNLLLQRIVSHYKPFAAYLPAKYEAIFYKLKDARREISVITNDPINSKYSPSQLVQKQQLLSEFRNYKSKSETFVQVRFNPRTLKQYGKHIQAFGLLSAAERFLTALFTPNDIKSTKFKGFMRNVSNYLTQADKGLEEQENSVFKELLVRLQIDKNSITHSYMQQVNDLQLLSGDKSHFENVYKQTLTHKEFVAIFQSALNMTKTQPRFAELIDMPEVPFWPTDKNGNPVLDAGKTSGEQAVFFSRNIWTLINTEGQIEENTFTRAVDNLNSHGRISAVEKLSQTIIDAEREMKELDRNYPKQISQDTLKRYKSALAVSKKSLLEHTENSTFSKELIQELWIDDSSVDAIDLFGMEGEKCVAYFMKTDPGLFHQFLLDRIEDLLLDTRNVERINQLYETPKSIKVLTDHYKLLRKFEKSHPDLYAKRNAFDIDTIFTGPRLSNKVYDWDYVNKVVIMLRNTEATDGDNKDQDALINLQNKLNEYLTQKAEENKFSELIQSRAIVDNIFGQDYYGNLLLSRLDMYVEQFDVREDQAEAAADEEISNTKAIPVYGLELEKFKFLLQLIAHSEYPSIKFTAAVEERRSKIAVMFRDQITNDLTDFLTQKNIDPEFRGKLFDMINMLEATSQDSQLDSVITELDNALAKASPSQFIEIWNAIPDKLRHDKLAMYASQIQELEELNGFLKTDSIHVYVMNRSDKEISQLKVLLMNRSTDAVEAAKIDIQEKLYSSLIDQLNKSLEINSEFDAKTLKKIFTKLSLTDGIASKFSAHVQNNLENYSLAQLRALRQTLPASLPVMEAITQRMQIATHQTISQLLEQHKIENVKESLSDLENYLTMMGKDFENLDEEQIANFTREAEQKHFVQSLSFLQTASHTASQSTDGVELKKALSILVELPIQHVIEQFSKNLSMIIEHEPDDKSLQLMFSQLILLSEASKHLTDKEFDNIQRQILKLKNKFFDIAANNPKIITEILANTPAEMWQKILSALPTSSHSRINNKPRLNKQQFIRLCEHVTIQKVQAYLSSPVVHTENTSSLNARLKFISDQSNRLSNAIDTLKKNSTSLLYKIEVKKTIISNDWKNHLEKPNMQSVTTMSTLNAAAAELNSKLASNLEDRKILVQNAEQKTNEFRILVDKHKSELAKIDTQENKTTIAKYKKEIDPEFLMLKEFIAGYKNALSAKRSIKKRLKVSVGSNDSNSSELASGSEHIDNDIQETKDKLALVEEKVRILLLDNNELQEKYSNLLGLENEINTVKDRLLTSTRDLNEARATYYRERSDLADAVEIAEQVRSETKAIEKIAKIQNAVPELSDQVLQLICQNIDPKIVNQNPQLVEEVKSLKNLWSQISILKNKDERTITDIIAAIDDEMFASLQPALKAAVTKVRESKDTSFQKVITQILNAEAKDSPDAPLPDSYKGSTNKLAAKLHPRPTVFEAKVSRLTNTNREFMLTCIDKVTSNQLISNKVDAESLHSVLKPKVVVNDSANSISEADQQLENDSLISKNEEVNLQPSHDTIKEKSVHGFLRGIFK